MKNAISVSAALGKKTLVFETGALAGLADASVLASIEDTVLNCAVSSSREPREGIDFFPLQVEYREKFYAAGRFPGGYNKREARPSEKEVLTMRVTDRPIRPLFPKGFHRDVQINTLVLSCDGENEPDMMNINAASCALMISELPFLGPIGACRVGRVDGEFIIEPTHSEMAESDLNLVYVGNRTKTLMIEGDAKEISEEDMVAAMRLAHEAIQPVLDAQWELRKKLGKGDKEIPEAPDTTPMLSRAYELQGDRLAEILLIGDKKTRGAGVKEVRSELKDQMLEAFPEMTEEQFFQLFDKFEIDLVRNNVLNHGKRTGLRGFEDMRELDSEVGLLPRTHGSALFRRGETQALALLTLGSKGDSQSIDAVTGGSDEKTFILHYNFPPYSVGEAGRLGATSRREIGHGNLAERSLIPVLPDDFPYSVRIVSEVMSSNGSTSMASCCSGTLALMDAGVKIKRPVAGISVGLFTNAEKSELVLDILGLEDHCGDMDFKVCGTTEGITAFQVDLKIHGLNWDQVEGAFALARKGRMEILDNMASCIAEPRDDFSKFAPRMEKISIDPEKIGALIGPGGKNIRRITDTLGVQIDIEDDGSVYVFASGGDAMEAAIREVNAVTAEPEIGETYSGRVTGTKPFGAFVEILPGVEGLVHISELAGHRVEETEDVCKVGDEMDVKVLDVDDRGKIRLSHRAVLEDRGEVEPRPPREEGEGGRGGDRRSGGGDRHRSGGDRRSGGGDRRRSGGGDRRRSSNSNSDGEGGNGGNGGNGGGEGGERRRRRRRGGNKEGGEERRTQRSKRGEGAAEAPKPPEPTAWRPSGPEEGPPV